MVKLKVVLNKMMKQSKIGRWERIKGIGEEVAK